MLWQRFPEEECLEFRRLHYKWLLNVCTHKLCNHADAEDLVEKIFDVYLRRFLKRKYRGVKSLLDESASAYLSCIASSRSIDVQRARGRFQKLLNQLSDQVALPKKSDARGSQEGSESASVFLGKCKKAAAPHDQPDSIAQAKEFWRLVKKHLAEDEYELVSLQFRDGLTEIEIMDRMSIIKEKYRHLRRRAFKTLEPLLRRAGWDLK